MIVSTSGLLLLLLLLWLLWLLLFFCFIFPLTYHFLGADGVRVFALCRPASYSNEQRELENTSIRYLLTDHNCLQVQKAKSCARPLFQSGPTRITSFIR